jgi:hypothetical protein
VADQLAGRRDADPAAQRTLALVPGDPGGLVVLGDEQLDAQQLLDLLDEILGGARRGPGGVDLGEDRVEGGVCGRFLRGARGGEREVGGGIAASALATSGPSRRAPMKPASCASSNVTCGHVVRAIAMAVAHADSTAAEAAAGSPLARASSVIGSIGPLSWHNRSHSKA